MSDARFICTKQQPWTPEKGTPVEHPDATEIGEQIDGWPSGDIVTYRCPNCNHEWEQELSQ